MNPTPKGISAELGDYNEKNPPETDSNLADDKCMVDKHISMGDCKVWNQNVMRFAHALEPTSKLTKMVPLSSPQTEEPN